MEKEEKNQNTYLMQWFQFQVELLPIVASKGVLSAQQRSNSKYW